MANYYAKGRRFKTKEAEGAVLHFYSVHLFYSNYHYITFAQIISPLTCTFYKNLILTVLIAYFPSLCVPVTKAWRVFRLRGEERTPIWRVVANKLNKQSRTADKGWSFSLGVGRDANNSSREKSKC